MKPHGTSLLFVLIVLVMLALPAVHAQPQADKKKGPTGKLYLVETTGGAKIIVAGKELEARQAVAFDATGSDIQTKDGAHQTFVFSNGTGMFVDEGTHVVVNLFSQEPFSPQPSGTLTEPSISQCDLFLPQGQLSICTSRPLAGTTLECHSLLGSVTIRGGQVTVAADDNSFTVTLLDGDASVRTNVNVQGGTVLHPGEQAVISPGQTGQPPRLIVSVADSRAMLVLDGKMTLAADARMSVSFEQIERQTVGSNQSTAVTALATGQTTASGAPNPTGDTTLDISAHPTVTTTPPTNITVSPDRLPGGV